MKKNKIIAVVCALTLAAANAVSVYAQPQEAEQKSFGYKSNCPPSSYAARAVEENSIASAPFLEEAGNTTGPLELMSVFDGGNGTAEAPFLVSNGDQLVVIGDAPSYCYQLINDIELEGNLMPLDVDGENFTGVLDGNGYAIRNLNMERTGRYGGLFAVNEGTIKNLRVYVREGGSVKLTYAQSNSAMAGILAGRNNGTISACGVYGDVSLDASQSDNTAFCGGLTGYNSGTVENSYAHSNVSLNAYSGYYGCIGGGIGYSTTSSVKNNYVVGTVTAQASSSNDKTEKGGFIGGGTASADVTSCYYDKQVSGLTDQNFGSEPKSSLGLKAQATFKNWEFDKVWGLDESINNGYPYIKIEHHDENTSVTGVTLSQTSAVMGVGDILELKATIEPEEMAEKQVSWDSSNPAVAAVSGGVVTAKSVGEAVITAAVAGIEAQCAVTVSEDIVKVESVILDKLEAGVGIGETVALKATVLPVNATNPEIQWSSSAPGVANVSAEGIVTGITEGTAEIYATSKSNSGCYAVCNLTVAAQKVAVTGVELDSNIFGDAFEVHIGKTLTLTPMVKPANATNKSVLWTSSDNSVASVVNGVITGLSE